MDLNNDVAVDLPDILVGVYELIEDNVAGFNISLTKLPLRSSGVDFTSFACLTKNNQTPNPSRGLNERRLTSKYLQNNFAT